MRNTGFQYILAVHGKRLIDHGGMNAPTYEVTPEPLCYDSGKTREDAIRRFCRSENYNRWRIQYWEYCEKDGTTII
jgi:hypothetical protein